MCPVVRTTAPARMTSPSAVTTPQDALPSSTTRSSTPGLDDVEVPAVPAYRRLHGLAVELAVGLRARALNGRPLGPVQHPELNAGRVGDAAHQSVERVDLPDQVALAQTANRRVAGHLTDGREMCA